MFKPKSTLQLKSKPITPTLTKRRETPYWVLLRHIKLRFVNHAAAGHELLQRVCNVVNDHVCFCAVPSRFLLFLWSNTLYAFISMQTQTSDVTFRLCRYGNLTSCYIASVTWKRNNISFGLRCLPLT